ncbi:unnamed protein product [Fusarium graminearum]|nr:unnamed protein product [Fusarium graminearum]
MSPLRTSLAHAHRMRKEVYAHAKIASAERYAAMGDNLATGVTIVGHERRASTSSPSGVL